ncbi:MAG: HIT family protein [bacterium]
MSTDSTDCVFCRIIRGEEKAYIVFEDDSSITFLDIRPLFPGHCLVVPKQHYETLADLPDDSIEKIFKNAKLVSQAVEIALKADGSFIGINNKVSQSVPHLHIHIIPRKRGDGLKGFFWPRTRYKDEKELLEIQSMIKASIEKMIRGKI